MTPQKRGLFISFEGGDGAGKSSQIKRLAEFLRMRGEAVILTREPGGSGGAEAIRKLLVEGAVERWSPMAEALMMYAARADHLERVILPALARGETVITDRFADSTMAYQGIAGGLGEETIARLHALVVADHNPDITLILDVATEVGLARAGGRVSDESRFERKGVGYHENVRQAFLKIARRDPERCVVIDASPDEETVFKSVVAAVEKKLRSRR
ncbi:MAG TPA: dTMP kinase [Parvularculaceae bacterium]|nr:dTMP kinase [Parvularculaceae bacterium]